MNKSEFRSKILKERDKLTKDEIRLKSKTIFDKVTSMKDYQDAEYIMAFLSFSTEVDTHGFIQESLDLGKKVLIPITFPEKNEIKVSEIRSFEELELGYYNILTHKEAHLRFTDPSLIDFILMPGVVFDQEGYRVGYGGGYYDRFLANIDKKVLKLAVAFDLQIVDRVPRDSYDIPVDIIVSEKRVLEVKSN